MKLTQASANWPVQLSKDEAIAIQAMQRGEAQAHQQKLLLKWIINDVARTYDNPYRLETHETAFASGRQFVGQQLVKFLNVNSAIFDKKPTTKRKPT